MLNETLAILKLCSKFGNKKDNRSFMNHVQVVKDSEKDEIKFYATTGYILIKVTCKELYKPFNQSMPDNITFDSINQACKVNLPELLKASNDAINFPPFEKLFGQKEETLLSTANFDCKYMALIFQSLEAFKKDIAMKLAIASVGPLSVDKANFITLTFNKGLQAEIKIQIAIMPVRQ